MCYQWECSLNRSTCTKNSTDVGRETNPGEVQWCPASRSGRSFDAVKMQRPFSSYCNPVHPRPPKSPMLWWDSSRWSTIIFDFIFNGRDFLCTLICSWIASFFFLRRRSNCLTGSHTPVQFLGRSTAKSFKNVGIVRVSLGEKKERRQKGFVNELCPG